MTATFAEFMKRIEDAGLPASFRDIPVHLLVSPGAAHASRTSGVNLCQFRAGGTLHTQRAADVAARSDLCLACFDGSLGWVMHLRGAGGAGMFILARLTLDLADQIETITRRVRGGRPATTKAVHDALNALSTLQDELAAPQRFPGTTKEQFEGLVEIVDRNLSALNEVVQSDVQRTRTLERLRSRIGKSAAIPGDVTVAGKMYVIDFGRDFLQRYIGKVQLLSETIAVFRVPSPSGLRLIGPAEVVQYFSVLRCRDHRGLPMVWEAYELPDDPIVQETALALWDKSTAGPLGKFSEAVRAAQAVQP